MSQGVRVNINEPRYDQSTFVGRARYFFAMTNPLNIFHYSPSRLKQIQEIVITYKNGGTIAGLTENQVWKAKHVYDSAFHPETGELLNPIGRIAAMGPANAILTVCMIAFPSTKVRLFWHWVNQTYNAIVNYSNRAGGSPISTTQLGVSYVSATAGAMGVVFGLAQVKSLPKMVQALVPFTAVASANCINLPMMRYGEIRDGVPVHDSKGNVMGFSKIAAREGVAKVLISRIFMAGSGLIITPLAINYMEQKGRLLHRKPILRIPMQGLIVLTVLWIFTPLGCALYPQNSSINVSRLEPEIQAKVRQQSNPPTVLWYNKGL